MTYHVSLHSTSEVHKFLTRITIQHEFKFNETDDNPKGVKDAKYSGE